MPDTKFLLIVGDNEEGIIGREEEDLYIRDIGCNFEHSPSIAALYETYAELVKEFATDLRAKGFKVGVYATREKAQRFFWKSLGMEWMGSAVTLGKLESFDSAHFRKEV